MQRQAAYFQAAYRQTARQFAKSTSLRVLPLMVGAIGIGIGILASCESNASGLDVQLKDLRHSYYFLFGTPKQESINSQAKHPQIKECIKLTAGEIRKYGRLLHCHPESDHVMCPLKSREKLFAYQTLEACNKALVSGLDQTPAD